MLSKNFYRIANEMTSGMLPESVSDFRLVNKRTYEAIRRMRESSISSWSWLMGWIQNHSY